MSGLELWEVLRNLAITYYHQNNFELALRHINEAIELNPKYVDAYNFKAWILATTNEREKAQEFIEKSITLQPDNAKSLLIYSYILYFLNSYDKSLEMINKSISKNSKDKEAWYLKGRLLTRLKEYDDAERCFSNVIRIDEKHSKAHNDKAFLLSRRNNNVNALDEIKKAVKYEPSSAIFQQNLTRLTLRETKTPVNFVDFWSATTNRKVIIILLVIAAIAVYLSSSGFIHFGHILYTSNLTNTTDVNQNQSKSLLLNIGNLPESSVIILGFIVLIILMPQIKSGKIGPLEFAMSLPEPSFYSSLELAEMVLGLPPELVLGSPPPPGIS